MNFSDTSFESCLKSISDNHIDLIGMQAWRLYKKRCAVSIVDPALGYTYPKDEVMKCIRIALLCTQSEHLRPCISRVVVMLANGAEIIPDPTIPAFIDFRSNRHSAPKNSIMSRSFGRAVKLVRFGSQHRNYAYIKLPLKLSHLCRRIPSN